MSLIAAHAPVVALATIDSTNLEARRRAEAGERGPLWVRADAQTAGRGRRGRRWVGQSGNLFATYLGVTHAPPAQIALLGFAAGLAVAETLEAFGGIGVGLKWPNDVLTADGKIAGILIETSPAPAGGFWFALGIGANLASAPDQIDQKAAALPAPVAAATFLSALSLRLAVHAAPLDRGCFAELRRAWLSRAVGLGARVTTLQGERRVEGRFVDLAEDGALVIETDEGMSRISAGDVLFAPAQQA